MLNFIIRQANYQKTINLKQFAQSTYDLDNQNILKQNKTQCFSSLKNLKYPTIIKSKEQINIFNLLLEAPEKVSQKTTIDSLENYKCNKQDFNSNNKDDEYFFSDDDDESSSEIDFDAILELRRKASNPHVKNKLFKIENSKDLTQSKNQLFVPFSEFQRSKSMNKARFGIKKPRIFSQEFI